MNTTRKVDRYLVVDGGFTSPCHRWLLALDGSNYGMEWVNERKRCIRAHVAAYERVIGPVPLGMQLDHLCRNRWCVNPGHLEPVTPAENCRRGANTRLCAGQVERIRDRIAAGDVQRRIAEDFGVSESLIYAIKTGRVWRESNPEQEAVAA